MRIPLRFCEQHVSNICSFGLSASFRLLLLTPFLLSPSLLLFLLLFPQLLLRLPLLLHRPVVSTRHRTAANLLSAVKSLRSRSEPLPRHGRSTSSCRRGPPALQVTDLSLQPGERRSLHSSNRDGAEVRRSPHRSAQPCCSERQCSVNVCPAGQVLVMRVDVIARGAPVGPPAVPAPSPAAAAAWQGRLQHPRAPRGLTCRRGAARSSGTLAFFAKHVTNRCMRDAPVGAPC